MLILKKFIIPFESGVVVIKHWKIHNYIQNDRYKETVYKDEKKLLVTDENKVYSPLENAWIQDGYSLDTQCQRRNKNARKRRGNCVGKRRRKDVKNQALP